VPMVGAVLRVAAFTPAAVSISKPAPARPAVVAVFGGPRSRRGRPFRSGGGSFSGGGGLGSGGGGGDGPGGFGDRGRGTGGRAGSGGGSGFTSGDSNPFKSILAVYREQLAGAPLLTKAATSFCGFAIATFLAECGGADKDNVWATAARNGAMGALLHGIGGHYYYGFTERLLPGVAPVQVAGKTAIDFLAFVPLIAVGFRIVSEVLKGTAVGDVVKDAGAAWKVPAPIWVMWSALMFSVTPVSDRVLFYNGVITLSAAAKKIASKADS
jgi:hypothetical protein